MAINPKADLTPRQYHVIVDTLESNGVSLDDIIPMGLSEMDAAESRQLIAAYNQLPDSAKPMSDDEFNEVAEQGLQHWYFRKR